MALHERVRLPERMDDPRITPHLHQQALRGLARLNAVSGVSRVLTSVLAEVAAESGTEKLRVLDVACGGGDVLVGCARRWSDPRCRIEFSGCDVSSTAVQAARMLAERIDVDRHNVERIDFFEHDVLAQRLPGEYDVVMSTLFLHHLAESDAECVLRRMREAARRVVVVDDLRRTRTGYFLAVLACRLLSRSPVVHYDGPVSVQAALTCQEMARLVERAGWREWTMRRHWPQRFLCIGRGTS